MIRINPLFLSLFLLFSSSAVYAQMSYEELPVRFNKVNNAFARVSDTVANEFKAKGLEWPARFMYIRAFKHEKQLEVWVKNDFTEAFQLFKVYKVCATSGTFGPKRKEGDKQIPEGFYYINEFKPNSNYHLALGLNYPNASDMILSDPAKPGGDIYIHGNCVTIGCLPLTDSLIEQVYYLSTVVKEQGQDFIPVHIYPYRFDYPKAAEQFQIRTKNKQDLHRFIAPLRDAYEFFEDTHQLPAVLITTQGDYLIATNPDAPKVERVKIVEASLPTDPLQAWQLEEKVDKVPTFQNGASGLQRWLFQLSQELSAKLEPNTTMSLQVEFIVDKEGNTRVPRVVKGGSKSLNTLIEQRFEKELHWNPALKNGIPVNTKLYQNLNLAAPEDLD